MDAVFVQRLDVGRLDLAEGRRRRQHGGPPDRHGRGRGRRRASLEAITEFILYDFNEL